MSFITSERHRSFRFHGLPFSVSVIARIPRVSLTLLNDRASKLTHPHDPLMSWCQEVARQVSDVSEAIGTTPPPSRRSELVRTRSRISGPLTSIPSLPRVLYDGLHGGPCAMTHPKLMHNSDDGGVVWRCFGWCLVETSHEHRQKRKGWWWTAAANFLFSLRKR